MGVVEGLVQKLVLVLVKLPGSPPLCGSGGGPGGNATLVNMMSVLSSPLCGLGIPTI